MNRDEFLDQLVQSQQQITKTEDALERLRFHRDCLIYTANNTHGFPITQIANTLGLRRETVTMAKMRGQLALQKGGVE